MAVVITVLLQLDQFEWQKKSTTGNLELNIICLSWQASKKEKSEKKKGSTRSNSRHWAQQTYGLAEGEIGSPLTGMTVNSFECHSTIVGCHLVTYKKWQMAPGVKYTVKMVLNRFFQAEWKSCKAIKSPSSMRSEENPKDSLISSIYSFPPDLLN